MKADGIDPNISFGIHDDAVISDSNMPKILSDEQSYLLAKVIYQCFCERYYGERDQIPCKLQDISQVS